MTEPGLATMTLRSAVIGTGFVGPHHVDAVRRTGYADVVALAGTDPRHTAVRARALGIPVATDVASILADPTIDVVHVCTPNRSHVALATAVLEAGKHLVLEKPIAIDRSGAGALVELGARSGRHAAVALTYRGYPMVRRARAVVAGGELGDLRLIHGGYLQDWLAEPTDWNWRLDDEQAGPSRAVADIGTHWFHTAEFVSGRRVEAVLADIATFLPERQRPTTPGVAFAAGEGATEPVTIRTEDAATVLVRFEGGARGALIVSQVSPGWKNGFTIELAGSRRSLGWAQEDSEVLWLRSRASSELLRRGPEDGAPVSAPGVPSLPAGHPEGWGEALRDLLRPFYAAIAAGDPPPGLGEPAPYPTLAEGARGVVFVEAVLASAREGRWTELAG